MLDRLSPEARHLALILITAAAGYGLTFIPTLDVHPALVGLGAVLITAVLAWATPLTKQYGAGATAPTPYNQPAD
jgi:hypothetical protein